MAYVGQLAAGAQLLWLVEGFEAVLSKCSDAASSTKSWSRCRMTPLLTTPKKLDPDLTSFFMRGDATTSCEHSYEVACGGLNRAASGPDIQA